MKNSKSAKEKSPRDGRPDVKLEECESEAKVDLEALDRCLQLLTKWAIRRGQAVLENTGIDPEDSVTVGIIKGYDAHDRSN